MSSITRIVVIGQGYVGLPLAMRAAEAGYYVVGIDLDSEKVADLRSGRSYVEDIPDEQLAAALASGRYLPTSDYSDADRFDVAVITVPTPLKESLPDISYIEAAVSQLAPHLQRDALVVLESTTYPGTTNDVVAPQLEGLSGLQAGRDFMVGYSPERIDPGNGKYNFVNTPKVVSGIDARSLAATSSFYSSLVDTIVTVSSPREAELAKLLENTFRHINIALVNEIAILARQLDINVWEALEAAATKPFGFMKFTPGPGVGGHCLPVDPSYLSWQVRRKLGKSTRFVELANDINAQMPAYVVERLIEGLNRECKSLNGSTVVLLGLAYKKNSSDVRESPSLRIYELLQPFGADVHVVDPLVDPRRSGGVRISAFSEDLIADADAVVILAAHDVFDLALIEDRAKYLLDAQHVTSGTRSEFL